VAGVIARYRPLGVPAPCREAVGAFARAVVAAAGPPGPASAARWLSATAALGAWALGEGLALEAGALCCPEVVDRFVEAHLRGRPAGTRRSLRAVLRRVGRAVAPRAWPADPERIGRSGAARPYSDAELAALLAAARHQRGAGTADAAVALICLGAGAGLGPADLRGLRGRDVAVEDGQVVVRARGRQVPVHPRFAGELAALARRHPEDLLVGGRHPGRKNLAAAPARLRAGAGVPRLELARLRASWWARVLAATGLREVLAAAGVSAPSGLFAHLARLGPPSPAEVRARLGALYREAP
jgi:integrase